MDYLIIECGDNYNADQQNFSLLFCIIFSAWGQFLWIKMLNKMLCFVKIKKRWRNDDSIENT